MRKSIFDRVKRVERKVTDPLEDHKRVESARLMMDSPSFRAAVETLERQFLEEFELSKETDVAVRERAYMKLSVLSQLVHAIDDLITQEKLKESRLKKVS